MIKYLTALMCFAFITPCLAQYKVAEAKTQVTFTVKNFGIKVRGSFSGLQGDITFNPLNATAGVFNVSLPANTINTANGLRDKHLKGEAYFDVEHYPRITFVSTKITAANGVLTVTGWLTIKNHHKEISFPFTAQPLGNGVQLNGSFTINRRDFEVGGFSTISNDVTITLDVFAAM